MTHAERSSWISLIGVALILGYFISRMLADWQVIDHPARELLWIYVTVILQVILLFFVAYGVQALISRRRGEEEGRRGVEPDARGRAIAARSRRNELRFLVIALNLAVVAVLADGLSEGETVLPRIETAADWMFTLLVVLGLASMVKDATVITLYRRSDRA